MALAPTQSPATLANVQPGEQMTFAAILKTVDALNARLHAHHKKQERVLRRLFASNSFDIDAGDLMFYGPGLQLDIPPKYAAQVRPNPLVKAGQFVFMKNPMFSLF